MRTLPPKLLFSIFTFFACYFLSAQEARQYSFTRIGASEGLASNEATAVLHDNEGFIWVGTSNGLQRYDGTRFISFKQDKDSPTALPSNHINQLLKDDDGFIWVLCGEDIVAILDPKKLTFTRVATNFTQASHNIRVKKLSKDTKGNIFLTAVYLETITWNATSGEFNSANNPFTLPKDYATTDITYQTSSGKYFIATTKGLVIYDSRSNTTSYYGNNTAREPLIDEVKNEALFNLYIDRKNRIWYDVWKGSRSHVFCYDLKNKNYVIKDYHFAKYVSTYYETHGYLEQKDGSIWIRGLEILGKFIEKDKQFQMVYNGYFNEQSIVFEMVTSFCEDRDNNIWITTANNGLYRFAPSEQFFTNVQHVNRVAKTIGKGSVLSFLQLPNNDILTGTWMDGLYRYDQELHEKPLDLPGINEKDNFTVWSMLFTSDSSRIFMGMQPGLGEYLWKEKKMIVRNPALLKKRTIRQIVEDKFGNLWLGMQGIGLFKWDAKKGAKNFDEGLHKINHIADVSISKIFIDSRGYIWVVTIGLGTYVMDPSTEEVLLHMPAVDEKGNPAPLANVTDVMEYNDTTMVLAGGSSIHLFNRVTRSIRTIGNENTIVGNITAVQKDDRSGYLWVSSTQGLYRVNINNKIFVHFNRIDGITDDKFTASASYQLKDGRILFGANTQFTAFQPKDVRINNSSPPVKITGFKIFNESLLVDSLKKLNRIELGPKQNSITIEFSGLNYNGAYAIKYMMKGLDETWKIADKLNQAVYTYLPAGNYTFMTKSQDADGRESVHVTELSIRILPHFWQTWWFYVLLILFGASILFWIDRERIRRMKEMQKIRSEIASNLHSDVTTTLSNINLLGEMAKIKADKDIDRSKEYIDQISAKSHSMIIAMDDILWSIDPENDSMEKTLLRMMEYTDALRHRHEAHIELSVDQKIKSMQLNMMSRHEFFLLFKEGLKLIVELAKGKNTLIQIDLFRNKLSLKLQDSTAKLDEPLDEIEAVIKNLNDRAGSVQGEADIQYDKNGIAIVIMMPVK